MHNPIVICKSFNRSNLKYSVIEKPPDKDALALLVTRIKQYPQQTTGIVYCLTQKDTVKVAACLVHHGIKCDFYHAGMNTGDRELVQAGWSAGHLNVVCATIAYGMVCSFRCKPSLIVA